MVSFEFGQFGDMSLIWIIYIVFSKFLTDVTLLVDGLMDAKEHPFVAGGVAVTASLLLMRGMCSPIY